MNCRDYLRVCTFLDAASSSTSSGPVAFLIALTLRGAEDGCQLGEQGR